MMSALFFIGIAALLITEGYLITALIARNSSVLLRLCLGLPIAALMNALITFDCTVLGIPLNALSLIGFHALTTIVIGAIVWKKGALLGARETQASTPMTGKQKGVAGICLLLLAATIIYSASHALLLPTFQYDSTTNWTMRSQISFYDQEIAFDHDEDRGMAKPMYPFLFHSLQITANQGQGQWSDLAANAILYLLTLGSFGALFLIIQKLRGRLHALLVVTFVSGIPLLSVHLAQGYGDLNLIQYLLLSLGCLLMFIEKKNERTEALGWLVLSAIFAVATAWTKSEGFVSGLLLWVITLGAIVALDRTWHRTAGITAAIGVIAWIPWAVFLMLKGLPLTPHENDFAIAFHANGFIELWPALLSRGSFGPLWYVLPAAVAILLWSSWKRDPSIDRKYVVTLLWGGLLTAQVLFTYVFTRNVEFLINGESFYRQMLLPAAIVILSCAVIVKPGTRTKHGALEDNTF